MFSSSEQKHLAVAALCGVALGAAVGAGAAVALSQPKQKEKKHLSHSVSELRGHDSAGGILTNAPRRTETYNLTAGGERAALQHVTDADLPRVLQELTLRMESLEQAVRTRLLSKSGTGSSLAGYLTAQESPDLSDENEEFLELDDDASRYGTCALAGWVSLYFIDCPNPTLCSTPVTHIHSFASS